MSEQILLELASKSLSDAMERLKAASEECRYWSGVVAYHAGKVNDEVRDSPADDDALFFEGLNVRGANRSRVTASLRTKGLAAIKEALKAHPGITRNHICGKSRKSAVVDARTDCVAAVHKACPDVSYPQLGDFFNMDHSSVIFHVRRAEKRREEAA